MENRLKVVELKSRSTEYTDSVVSMLTDYIEMAKTGKLVSVGIAAVQQDGYITVGISKTERSAQLLGAISHLSYMMNQMIDEVATDGDQEK